jgi:transcriptional regulator with XRE-family HTH domain
MTSRSSNLAPLTGRDRADYGVARLRDQAFDAVQQLWEKRRAAGVTQKALAEAIGRDQGWVSRNLRAPGNWTLRTIAELAQALRGEIEIRVVDLDEPIAMPSNYDAYASNESEVSTAGNARVIALTNQQAMSTINTTGTAAMLSVLNPSIPLGVGQ